MTTLERYTRVLYEHWRLTVAYLLIFASFMFTVVLVRQEASHRVRSVCDSITQVKNAALNLTAPASAVGVTDPTTLERIRQANAARDEARKKLDVALACKKG